MASTRQTASPRSRYVNLQPTPENFRALWDRVHDLDSLLDEARHTLTTQATTITDLRTHLADAQARAQQALILAGKAVAQTSQGVSPAPGGGGDPGGNGDAHPNYLAQVVQAKADLITAGVNLAGACGGFEITKRAVQYIAPSDPAVGLLDKQTGTNCGGYAIDIVCFNDGVIYDVLFDAENSSPTGVGKNPQWNFKGVVDSSRYRPPI